MNTQEWSRLAQGKTTDFATGFSQFCGSPYDSRTPRKKEKRKVNMGATHSEIEQDPAATFLHTCLGVSALNNVYTPGMLVQHSKIGDLTTTAVRKMIKDGALPDELNEVRFSGCPIFCLLIFVRVPEEFLLPCRLERHPSLFQQLRAALTFARSF